MDFLDIKMIEGNKASINLEDISSLIEREEKPPMKSYVEIYLKSDTFASFKTYSTIEEIKEKVK